MRHQTLVNYLDDASISIINAMKHLPHFPTTYEAEQIREHLSEALETLRELEALHRETFEAV